MSSVDPSAHPCIPHILCKNDSLPLPLVILDLSFWKPFLSQGSGGVVKALGEDLGGR